MLWPSLKLDSPGIKLSIDPAPWDCDALGYPTAAVGVLRFDNPHASELKSAAEAVAEWVNLYRVRLITCRLPIESMAEAMWLESLGFRFIETVLHPILDVPLSTPLLPTTVKTLQTTSRGIGRVSDIAGRAFRFERYHADPRVDDHNANKRYANWIRDSFERGAGTVYELRNADSEVCGFFLVEIDSEGTAHWILTAIAPEYQGQGLGLQGWSAMINRHIGDPSVVRIASSITVGNTPVMNLYSRLGFRFGRPEVTFHWFPGA